MDKRGRGDAQEALEFHLRQCTLRTVERRQQSRPRVFDRVFAVYLLHYEARDHPMVVHLMAKGVREEHPDLDALLSDPATSDPDTAELRAEAAELAEAARGATVPSDFWRACVEYLDALGATREHDAAHEAGRLAPAVEDRLLQLLGHTAALARTAAELKALARSTLPAVDRAFFETAALMAALLAARNKLRALEVHRHGVPLPAAVAAESAVSFVAQTEAQAAAAMRGAGDDLEADQQLCMDEIAAYAAAQPLPPWALQPGASPRKPDRFAKVVTGYTWTKYNRAHYDINNPPPRTIQAYEFTLMYPELRATHRVPKYRVVATERGFDDDHCLLVFSAGAPYLDVAYRVVNAQWDPRKGGVRCTFDPSGRFKLYFRLATTQYRR